MTIHTERPQRLKTASNRRDTAGEKIKHFIRENGLRPEERLPTVRQLSEHFGVTRDAVWRALRSLQKEQWIDLLPNKRYAISKELHTRILRSLRVKALFSGKGYIYFSGFRRLADSLVRECRYHNLDLQIELLPLGKKPEAKIWKDCDLLMIDSDSSVPVLSAFEKFPVPVIGLDANFSDRYQVNVVTDHYLGGRMAAEAFLKRRAREIVVLYHAGSEGNHRVAARIEGFRQAWLEGGHTTKSLSLVAIEWSQSSFEVALKVRDFLDNYPPHGNFFVTDGRLATNFLEVLAYKMVAVPEKVRLIGYDGTQRGELTDPPMTSIQQDMERIAQTAVNWVRQIAEGRKDLGVLERIAPRLIERKSF